MQILSQTVKLLQTIPRGGERVNTRDRKLRCPPVSLFVRLSVVCEICQVIR